MLPIELKDLVFYILAGLAIASAGTVVLIANPIFSALTLAITMISVAAIFFTLDAYFIAAVQLMIYAGAVMVMFVMVIMLFDLKEETKAFSRGLLSLFLKVSGSALLLGMILSSIQWASNSGPNKSIEQIAVSTKDVAMHLFMKYMIGFQFIGVLLLVVLVGAIAIARAKGGTHAS